jgi:hypothetical protein
VRGADVKRMREKEKTVKGRKRTKDREEGRKEGRNEGRRTEKRGNRKKGGTRHKTRVKILNLLTRSVDEITQRYRCVCWLRIQ